MQKRYLLFIVIITFLLSESLFAGTYSGGSGTSGDPYKIATTADLIELSTTSGDWDKHFIQTANISFDADETQVDWDNDGSPDGSGTSGFAPIGNGTTPAACSYYGQNHTIKNLFINRPNTDDVGLFGWKKVNPVISLGVVNADITGQNNVGAVAGRYIVPSAIMTNCFSTGTVSGADNVGGLVGKNYSDIFSAELSNIDKSYSLCDVSGTSNVGGFVGYNNNSGQYADITDCWSSGDVTRSSGTNTSFGAFCGNNSGGNIDYSYATGSVFQSDGATALGTDNGFVGTDNSGSYYYNFFDTDVSNQSTGTGATGKTTAQMQTESTFTNAGWDFTDTWAMSSSITFNEYPTLQWTGAYAEVPSGSPYQITSLPNLVWIAEDDSRWSNDYEQTADINAWTTPSWDDGKGWTPIGNSTLRFTGNYDGGGYTISNLYIDRSSTRFIALFGYTDGSTISNTGIKNCDITGKDDVGGLVGISINASKLSNSYSTGSVSGNNYLGGLVGLYTSSEISNCYSRVDVTCSSTSYTYIGGFCGWNYNSTIEYCYSIGSVYYDGDTAPTGKGFVGDYGGSPSYTANFFDSDASNQSTATGATAKTTDEMNQYATFSDAGWSFCPPGTHTGGTWTIDESTTSPDNDGYPALFWQGLTNNYVASTPGLWTGVTDTDWSTASNWDDETVPTSSVDVTIPSGCTNYPAIDETANCQSIEIQNGGSLEINSAYSLEINGDFTLQDGGSFTNNGTIIFTDDNCHLNDNRSTKASLGNIEIGN